MFSFNPWHSLSLIRMTLVLFVVQPALLAQQPEDLILLTLRDEGGHRVEVVISEEIAPGKALVRHYEDGDVLILEQPLQGSFAFDGMAMTGPIELSNRNPDERLSSHGDPRPLRVMVVTAGCGEGRQPDRPITDNSGTGVPPTGPPPSGSGQ